SGVRHVAQLLDGRIPGVEVTRLADGDYAVRVRGASSGGGEPLVVVDGVPYAAGAGGHSVLADLSPGDVARIDVLKGAAAAVYGLRGTNGVIVVTLRRPRQ